MEDVMNANPWPSLALQYFPWISLWGMVAWLNRKRLLPWISPMRYAASAALSISGIALAWTGFGYEGGTVQEWIVPAVLFWPCLGIRPRAYPRFLACIGLLSVFTISENIKCTQSSQWLFPPDTRYLFWARGDGTALEGLLYFGGPAYPVSGEFLFYPAAILGTAAYAALLQRLRADLFAASGKLRWFFPAIFGTAFAILFALIAWYGVSRSAIPYHACAAAFSILLLAVFRARSPQVRQWSQSPAFACLCLFGIAQTALFDCVHSAILSHWIYTGNGLASLAPWLVFRFPALSLLGIKPVPLPLEEVLAYPGMFVFVVGYLRYCHSELGFRILKAEVKPAIQPRDPH
jgi:hypothetical protein